MLKGISPLVSPDLLKYMSEMGHGDTLIISDRHYPAQSTGQRVVRADGATGAQLLKAIAPLFEIDTYEPGPVKMIECCEGDDIDPQVEKDYREALGWSGEIVRVNRFDFYEAARKAYVIVISGEARKYGCISLCKGVTAE